MRFGLRQAGVVLVALAGCSSDSPPRATPTTIEGPTIEGMPAERYNAAVAEWDAVVAEWNALPVEQRPYETFGEWAEANGKPAAFEDVLAKYR